MTQEEQNTYGRVARRLIALIEAEGYEVVLLKPAQGFWRTNIWADVYRWEAVLKHKTTGAEFCYGSWDTMTQCVKRGISVCLGAQEVWAK